MCIWYFYMKSCITLIQHEDRLSYHFLHNNQPYQNALHLHLSYDDQCKPRITQYYSYVGGSNKPTHNPKNIQSLIQAQPILSSLLLFWIMNMQSIPLLPLQWYPQRMVLEWVSWWPIYMPRCTQDKKVSIGYQEDIPLKVNI